MSKSYEELMGAAGRSIFFRPERRRVRELMSREAEPKLFVRDAEYKLFDVSMNGLSFWSQSDPYSWKVGSEIEVKLMLNGEEVYQGLARVARTEVDARGTRVGLALTTGFIDLPDIRGRGEEARLERDLQMGATSARAAVPAEFRVIVDEAVHFAQYYRQVFGRHEKRYRSMGVAGRDDVKKLAEWGLDALRLPWDALRRRAARAALECLPEPEALRAAKQYTETTLTPLLLEAPMIHRSYTKPLGYPGDYQVMNYYYNNALEGETVFGQVMHKLFVEHPLSAGVRTRCGFVVDLMRGEHDRVTASSDSATYRVTSLGCGPARESALYARNQRGWSGEVVWTLIDQEEETLSVAYHDTQIEVARSGALGLVRCLNVAFGQLFGGFNTMPLLEPQDFIFSTGLFDYLREGRARDLLRALYERLAPGGLLAIGNAMRPNEHFWEPEFILDWTLLYRTREEMLRVGADLPTAAVTELATEPGEAYYFLLVRKPA